VVLGGAEFTDFNDYNMAYEVTDCGIVVGQMNRQIAAVPVYQGFFYLDRPRFGRPAGHLEFLPALLPNGEPSPITPSIARDVNADGWIVGDMGKDPEDVFSVRRAAAWRLSDAPTSFVRTITPPQPGSQSGEPQRVDGWLGAVSEGEEPWAAFTFEGPFCALGGTLVRSDLVASVRLDLGAGPSEPLLVRMLAPECNEPDVTDQEGPSARLVAHGMSPDGSRVCGSRRTCGYLLDCGQPVALRARQWLPDPDLVNSLDCVTCLTPNEVPELPTQPPDFFAEQRSVLDDGTAVGFVADGWTEVGSNSCSEWAYAWNPFDAGEAPQCSPLFPATAIGTRLPIPDLMLPLLRRSEAFDIERNPTTANGRRAGHFAVGDVVTRIPDKPDLALRGLVWFAEGDQVSDWAVADINQMVSPTPPIEGYSSFVVRALRGVNARGDAVGMAEFTPTDDPDIRIRRAVLLRAVPSGLAGDLDGDGMVGASDLAILLGAWCTEASASCDPIADLNCDGLVNAADLTALLANWGNGSGTAAAIRSGEPVPEAIALDSKDAVEFSIEFVGLDGVEGYKEWAATAPAPLRELVEQVVWNTAKGGVE
jgi:hypothetical protein